MKYNINKLCDPKQEMPAPGQYFQVAFKQNENTLQSHICVLKAYCGSENFYENCIYFTREGNCFNVSRLMHPIGWFELHEKTKTFRIENL
jgi:hypothetical protein